jgi:hypothetical protein
MIKMTAIAVAIVLCVAGALGQGRTSGRGQIVIRAPRPIVGFAPSGRRPLIGLSGTRRGEGARRRFSRDSSFYGGWPYFPPEYDAYGPEQYDTYGPEPLTPAQQVTPTTAPKLEPIPSGALLELQGDRWVKVSSFATGSISLESAPTKSGLGTPVPSAKELPPAILVYRDGHTEELSSYSIIGVTIYTKADYWTSGAWTRKIQIAELDLPTTLKQNHERGLAFQLPSGPDEVILRP